MDKMWTKAEDANLVVAKPDGLYYITSFAEYIWEPYYWVVVLNVNSNFVRRFMLTRQIPSEKSYKAVVFFFSGNSKKKAPKTNLGPDLRPRLPVFGQPDAILQATEELRSNDINQVWLQMHLFSLYIFLLNNGWYSIDLL